MTQSDILSSFRARPDWWGTGPLSVLADVQQLFRDSTDPLDETEFWEGLLDQIRGLESYERADVEFYIVKSLAESGAPGFDEEALSDTHKNTWALLEKEFGWTKSQAWLAELISQGDFLDPDQRRDKLMMPLSKVENIAYTKTAKKPTAVTRSSEPDEPVRPSFWEAKSIAKREAERKKRENPGNNNGLILGGIVVFVALVAGFFAWAAGLLTF